MGDTRIEWIDIAKGIVIILVIAGHTFYLGYSYPLYAFHMPLFFFLSGLLFKDKKEGFYEFWKSKTKSLLKPWLIILLISFLLCLMIPEWRNQITLNAVLADLYTANTNVFQNSSLWYLVCFYFVLIEFFFVNKLKITRVTKLCILLFAIAFLWSKEALNMINIPFHRLPFKIDSALIALVFFLLAYWYKEPIKKYLSYKLNLFVIFLIVIVSAIACYFNGWSNINSLDFGSIRLLYYPIAMMGIGSVCISSIWLSSTTLTRIKALFTFYGKNSLLIFGFQSLLIRLYLLLFNYIEGIDMQLYGANSMKHQIGAFCIVSFIMSPVVVLFIQFLRKHKLSIL